MTRANIAIKGALFLLGAACMIGIVGTFLPRGSTYLTTDVLARAVHVRESARGAEPGHAGLRLAFTGAVEARSSDALDAKWQVDRRISLMGRLAEREGGRITLGEIRYLRSQDAGGGPRRSAEIWIIQQVDIELPDSADRARLEAELTRISFVPQG